MTFPRIGAIDCDIHPAVPNLKALQSNLELQKQVGLLNTDIDVKKFSDLSMVEEAAKRLG